jgi:hypothetical protein
MCAQTGRMLQYGLHAVADAQGATQMMQTLEWSMTNEQIAKWRRKTSPRASWP